MLENWCMCMCGERLCRDRPLKMCKMPAACKPTQVSKILNASRESWMYRGGGGMAEMVEKNLKQARMHAWWLQAHVTRVSALPLAKPFFLQLGIFNFPPAHKYVLNNVIDGMYDSCANLSVWQSACIMHTIRSSVLENFDIVWQYSLICGWLRQGIAERSSFPQITLFFTPTCPSIRQSIDFHQTVYTLPSLPAM